MNDELVLGSVWMAVENMLLTATDEGLGSCIYAFLNRNEENKLKRILNARQRDRIACMFQLGYTKTEPIPLAGNSSAKSSHSNTSERHSLTQ
jgi:nitroreductase